MLVARREVEISHCTNHSVGCMSAIWTEGSGEIGPGYRADDIGMTGSLGISNADYDCLVFRLTVSIGKICTLLWAEVCRRRKYTV